MRTQQPIDVRPVLLVLIGSLGIQSSALISSTLFAQLGTVAVSTFRLVLASAIMLVVFRPPLRRFSRARWMNAGVYGVALAAMNQFYFAAVDRIPLGVAVTLDFLGPACVSFFGLRHSKERHWAIVAFVGVVLIAGPSSGLDRLGILFGLLAGAFFGLYTVYAERLGKAEGGLGDLAISVSVAALVALPFTIQEVTALDLHAVAVLAIAALVGVVIPYVADNTRRPLLIGCGGGDPVRAGPGSGFAAGMAGGRRLTDRPHGHRHRVRHRRWCRDDLALHPAVM